MAEIGQVVSPEQFKVLLKWLEDGHVCIRNGVNAENACYQLDDFGKGQPGEIDMKEFGTVVKW